MLKIRQERPTERHWQAIENLQFKTIDLDLFCSHWEVTHLELAELTGASYSAVRKWFCRSSNLHPSEIHLLRLALVHKRWLEIR